MARRGGRDRGKERFWRSVMRRWRRSGQTVRAFCGEQGLAEPCFYAWRRTIAERDGEWADATPSRGEQADELPTFVPLRVTAPAPAALELVVGVRVIRVAPGFDAATLRHLLAVVEEASPC